MWGLPGLPYFLSVKRQRASEAGRFGGLSPSRRFGRSGLLRDDANGNGDWGAFVQEYPRSSLPTIHSESTEAHPRGGRSSSLAAETDCVCGCRVVSRNPIAAVWPISRGAPATSRAA